MNGKPRQGPAFTTRALVLVFSLCAIADFGWSMFKRHSVAESVISATLGLFGTAWYLFIMWGSSHNDPDDRWVP